MKKLREWLENRRAEKEWRQYSNGYDWAAGALLRGEETPASAEAYMNQSTWTPFDSGAEDATNRLVDLGVVQDDRI